MFYFIFKIRNDFIQSARSMIPKREYNKKPVESIR